MIKSTDHVERGLRKLISEHRTPLKQAWLAVYLQRIQELEDALWEIIELRTLSDGVGVQLDLFGRLVGRGRNGLSDDHYRLAIRTQIRINRSQGLSRDLTAVLKLSVPEDTLLEYQEHAIATAHAIIGPGDYDLESVISNLRNTKAAGVRLWLQIWSEPAFTFSVDGTATIDTEHGWGSVYDPDMGGFWSHLLEILS